MNLRLSQNFNTRSAQYKEDTRGAKQWHTVGLFVIIIQHLYIHTLRAFSELWYHAKNQLRHLISDFKVN